MVPSAFTANSASITSSKAWLVETRSSRRSLVHFTGRPSLRAAAATRISSGYTDALPPNPPPTSGAITRTLLAGRSSASARASRTMPGIWVVECSVRLPARYSARQARFSIAIGVLRWKRKRPPTVTAAFAISMSTSPRANSRATTTFEPASSCSKGAPSAAASSISVAAGSGSYWMSISSAASSAR